jgi:hypothetical protein
MDRQEGTWSVDPLVGPFSASSWSVHPTPVDPPLYRDEGWWQLRPCSSLEQSLVNLAAVLAFFTAMASAFRLPTTITIFRPRVTPV